MNSTISTKIENYFKYKIKSKIDKILYKQLNLQWVLRSGLKIKIENNAEWVIYNDIFVDREYDLAITEVLANSKLSDRPLNILDIGANVGFFTLRFADLMLQDKNPPTNFSFTLVEGSPRVYNQLKSRLIDQKDLVKKLNIIHGLVGKRQGSAKIVEFDFHVMNAIASENSSQAKGINVPYIDLISVYPKNIEIDLLKCDIEGSELVFLENYQDFLSQVKRAVFELHHDRCDTARCCQILKDVGFVNHQNLRTESNFSVDFFWK